MLNSQRTGWLVAYDFAERPTSTFYSLLDALSGDGGLTQQQKSVYLCKDAEMAQRLVTLCRAYGVNVVNAVQVVEGSLDLAYPQSKAEEWLSALQAERLKRRGRKPTVKRKRT